MCTSFATHAACLAVDAMKDFADANSIVGSVRNSRSGGIEGRVQADAALLEKIKAWMESKGSVNKWEEALKHPFKEFKILRR